MIYYGPMPVEDWPLALLGLMEHIEAQREPLTTCDGCGALVRPSEHCPSCAIDAHLDDLMAMACLRERTRRSVEWLQTQRDRHERGKVTLLDAWAVALSLPLIWFMVECVNRF